MEGYNKAEFTAYANNVFVKILTAVMLNKLIEVKHFMSDNLYARFVSEQAELNGNNQRKMYDELNVAGIEILEHSSNDKESIVQVRIMAKYLSYVLDLNTNTLVSGQNDSRIQRTYILQFNKSKDAKTRGIVSKCPTCGSTLDTNNSGLCSFCHTTFNQESYDWILTQFNAE